jgi:hypothetical protein
MNGFVIGTDETRQKYAERRHNHWYAQQFVADERRRREKRPGINCPIATASRAPSVSQPSRSMKSVRRRPVVHSRCRNHRANLEERQEQLVTGMIWASGGEISQRSVRAAGRAPASQYRRAQQQRNLIQPSRFSTSTATPTPPAAPA